MTHDSMVTVLEYERVMRDENERMKSMEKKKKNESMEPMECGPWSMRA
jgi:hypothetical protein